MTAPLQLTRCFGQNHGQVKYEGQRVVNAHECHTYFETRVNPRLTDRENAAQVEADLRDLATTDMETETIERLLRSTSPVEPWEVGEAMAECLLEDFYSIKWPWNMERDKRTPRASLPGADLVGFWQEGDDVYLVLGEVKTSEDIHTPPNNMTGRSGMTKQLENLVHNYELHFCLMKWLSPRCKGTRFEPLYRQAIERYVRSHGKDVRLFGFLMRDTTPNAADVDGRAAALAKQVTAPTRIALHAWYLPDPISTWPQLVGAA